MRSSLLFAVRFAIGLSVRQAQTSFGTIVGFVQDQGGRAITNGPVKVLNTATGIISTVRTQFDGNSTAINLFGEYLSVQEGARTLQVAGKINF